MSWKDLGGGAGLAREVGVTVKTELGGFKKGGTKLDAIPETSLAEGV